MLDLELIITRTGEDATATLRAELPTHRVDLAEDVPLPLNEETLRAVAYIPEAYGVELTKMVFVPALREAWTKAVGNAEGRDVPLRVRLHLRGDEALHAIRWELLIDPFTKSPLAYRERVAFSRFLSSTHMGDTPPVPPSQLRAVVAVADAGGPGMAAVDVAGEVSRAQTGLGDLPVTILDGRDGRPTATLAHLADALRSGPHILALTCHGALIKDQPYLYLAGDDPYQPTPGAELVRQLADLQQRPLMLILASCQGAGDGYAVLSALGPQLARLGIGAVLAMQGDVPMALVAALMPRLFTELRRDGQIDRALAAARAALPADQPYWQPVLWLAVRDGALWRQPAAPAARGAGVFQVPYAPNPHFCGRDAELQRLAEVLLGAQAGTAAISGMGGLGKTQLASEFAHAQRDQFPGGVFWLSMAQPATIANQVAAAGGPGGLNLPGWEAMDFATKLAAVKRAWNEPVRRLLIFDNLEEPELLQQWRPSSGDARILITTRRGVWAARTGVQPLALKPLARPASQRLLLEPRHGDQVETVLRNPSQAAEADTICEQVGDLPLALALAGAYLEQSPSLTLAGYRQRLAAMLLCHPSLEAELDEGLPTAHATSIAATIALSYERLDPTRPNDALALNLLRRMAHLAPEPIPQRLLVRLAERDPDDEDQAAEVDAPLRRLVTVGLVDRLPTGEAQLHRLVAAFVRDQDAEAQASLRRAATELIGEVAAINQAGYPLRGKPYLPHLNTLVEHAAQLEAPQAATLYSNLGQLHYHQGDLAEARTSLEQALAIREQALGPKHPDTANSLNNLGVLLKEQGDLAGAKPYYERALAIHSQALGPTHPSTAQSLNNLGVLLKEQGNLAGARVLCERALAIYEQVQGPSHPDTATSLNNLGHLLSDQGDFAKARPYYERALAIFEQALGPAHPSTATSLNNLGSLLEAQGDLAGARVLYERALAIREQVLGPTHLDTSIGLNNLGHLLSTQGDLAGARSLYERALAICEQALGPTHPSTATSLNNLGHLLSDQGDFAKARPYYERALAIFEQALGPAHPSTATSLNNLGSLLEAQGDLAGARVLYERALAIREQVLGPTHLDTSIGLNNLGSLLQDQGDLAGARAYYERALAIREQVLGPNNPDTATSLNNLGSLLKEQGNLAGARVLCERALAIKEQVLGSTHPATASSLDNLGHLQLVQADPAAQATYERLCRYHPTRPLAHYWLALACLAAGADQRALAALDKDHAQDQSPDSRAYNQLWRGVVAQAQGDPGQAQDHWHAAARYAAEIADAQQQTRLTMLLALLPAAATQAELDAFGADLPARTVSGLQNMAIYTRILAQRLDQPVLHAAHAAVQAELARRRAEG